MSNITFFQGWEAAIEAAETRLEAIMCEIDSHTTPHDVALDLQNELSSLKEIHLAEPERAT